MAVNQRGKPGCWVISESLAIPFGQALSRSPPIGTTSALAMNALFTCFRARALRPINSSERVDQRSSYRGRRCPEGEPDKLSEAKSEVDQGKSPGSPNATSQNGRFAQTIQR